MEARQPDKHRIAELEIAAREMRLHLDNIDAFLKQIYERLQRLEKEK